MFISSVARPCVLQSLKPTLPLETFSISDRTKVGLERARRNGKVLGRPDGFELWVPILKEMKEQEFLQGKMSRETGLSYDTVKKYMRRLDAEH